MNMTQLAGGVVMNSKGEVVVVAQPNGCWSLPKGHIDEGEDALTAAKREIREETGITDLAYIRPLGSYQRFKIGLHELEDPRKPREIHLFLFRTSQEHLQPEDAENTEARWVRKEDVAKLLTHPKDGEFFRSVLNML
ncbi:NUDIX domain-containing protein [Candidatus Woesearchaeota archaeon]|nr:NUDIX domain-containing protein [Candidatus Woesearchaeota archaeon]